MAGTVQRPPPAIDVIESEELLQYIHPDLLKIDYNSEKVRAITIGSTFVFFTATFVFSMVMCNFFQSFRNLKLKHRVFMSLAVSRGIFGAAGLFLGSFALFKTTNLDRDVVFGRSATSAMAMYFTLGFFIFELAAVIISDICFKSFSKMLITHHGLALLGFILAIRQESNYSFGNKALTMEMSTPFSCLCFVLLKAGKENTLAWKINQLLLVHAFHLRNVVEVHLWYLTYKNWEYIWNYMPMDIFVIMYFQLILVSFIMTPYWGYKKTQQLFNPVDWNFEESKDTEVQSNGDVKKKI